MALLDFMANNNQQINPNQVYQLLAAAQNDPFSKMLPGEGLLGGGNYNSLNSQAIAPQLPEVASTQFADTQRGLPNFPQSFSGFGFGSFAPKPVPGNPLRQQIVNQLLQMLPQMGGFNGLIG